MRLELKFNKKLTLRLCLHGDMAYCYIRKNIPFLYYNVYSYGLLSPSLSFYSFAGRKSERAIARPCLLLRFGKTDANVRACVIENILHLIFFNVHNADYVDFSVYLCSVFLTLTIMRQIINIYHLTVDELSKLLNRTFRVKIGRTLYGFSGCVRLLGLELLKYLLSKALRSLDDVVRFECTKLQTKVSFYFK